MQLFTLHSSARGNTTLESAVVLTKSLRWEIQALGVRLEKAATAEERSRKSHGRANSKQAHEVELRQIVLDIRRLLSRIEDAVPLINLAITTSGARLSTTLPSSVSPSRLLQASTFLTAGDTQYGMGSGVPVQVGPAFNLSLYMLFSGHARRLQDSTIGARETTWKEVMHKARVRIMRVPLDRKGDDPVMKSIEDEGDEVAVISGGDKANEFNYHIEIIEDFNDDRVHSFEDDEPQPERYGDIKQAGIREFLPIHQIAKIFYADTGKILNIGTQGETNNPVLLIKRDIHALPPRRMMQESEHEDEFLYEEDSNSSHNGFTVQGEKDDDSQDGIDAQLRRESSVHLENLNTSEQAQPAENHWRLPQNLDPEWLALEVYTEAEGPESDDEDDNNEKEDSSYGSHYPSPADKQSSEEKLATDMSNFNLKTSSATSPPTHQTSHLQATPFGPVRSSLSLLEMLIRLTALQQFQQAPHLAIPDELLTFFLEESSTTGAGGDTDERRRTRREARQKVGFDPYDESPIKRRGEDYQYQNQGDEGAYSRGGASYSRAGTPYEVYDSWQRSPRQESGEDGWLRNRESPRPSRNGSNTVPSSPLGPFKPLNKSAGSRPLNRVQSDRKVAGSPLGRGVSVDTDSTLGTSPGSPTLLEKRQ